MRRICAPILVLCVAMLPACQRNSAPTAANNASGTDSSVLSDEGMNMTATASPPDMNASEVPSVASGNASGSSAPRERFISCPGDPRCRR